MRCFRVVMAVALGIASGAAQAQFTGPIRTAPAAPRSEWRAAGSASSPIDTWRESQDIRDRIRDGQASGQLSRTEARRLRRENAQLRTLASRYGSDGMSDAEAAELATRAAVLRDQVNLQRLGAAPGSKRP